MLHEKYMHIAINLALKAKGFTFPNPMVGAIIVNNNKIVGKGYHRKAGEKHAEIQAINNAGSYCKNATLYVTLEPCNHTGKTPPCTKTILTSGIKHVVFSTKDPNTKVRGNGENYLITKGIKVTSGVCKKEASMINESFIKYKKTGLPLVIAKCASTLDGRIATSIGNSKWITGKKAREYTHQIRHNVDAILIGKNTVNYDNPSLTTRLKNKRGTDPARIILDTNLSIKQNSKVIKQKSLAPTYIITGNNINIFKKKCIEKTGTKIISLNSKNNKINIEKVIKIIAAMGFNSLLIEGGGEILGSALSLNLIDKIYFFYAPKILGEKKGISMCNGPIKKLIKNSTKVHNLSIKKLGVDLLIQGYLKNIEQVRTNKKCLQVLLKD